MKYKIGDKVTCPLGDVHEVVSLNPRYYVQRIKAASVRNGANIGNVNEYAEWNLKPYVEPIKAGDKVRTRYAESVGEVGAIKEGVAAVWIDGDWQGVLIENCERIDP